MPPVRKILIADPDPETVRLLAPPLRQRGYQVHAARDGSRALQVAVLRFPDLIILDEKAPLLDPHTFVRILRTNPRTERIPVLLTGEGEAPDRARQATWLRKPLRLDEVLARVEQLFHRDEESRAADLEGNLAQIPLTDLLQILSVNRRSGRLTVERGGQAAEVVLRDGRVIDARLGLAVGDKAVWRLLGWREGQFSFAPGQPEGPDIIDRPIDHLILEGMRQSDELAELRQTLPADGDAVELAVGPAEIPEGLHPATAQVVASLAEPCRVSELIDRCTASDLEAARALMGLLDAGYVRLAAEVPAPAEPSDLLAPHELHALKQRVARGRTSGTRTIGKVVVAGGGPLSRPAALARFSTLPGYQPGPSEPGPFGTLGRLTLGDGVRVDLVALPDEPEQRPLWRPFGAGAVGALVLLPIEGDGLLEELVGVLRVPVVVCGPAGAELPGPLRGGAGRRGHRRRRRGRGAAGAAGRRRGPERRLLVFGAVALRRQVVGQPAVGPADVLAEPAGDPVAELDHEERARPIGPVVLVEPRVVGDEVPVLVAVRLDLGVAVLLHQPLLGREVADHVVPQEGQQPAPPPTWRAGPAWRPSGRRCGGTAPGADRRSRGRRSPGSCPS